MTQYQVIDLRSAIIDPEPVKVEAGSPEKAAEKVLGIHLVRSGARKDLVARVYWQKTNEPKNMVRLYAQVVENRIRTRTTAEPR
ncbi:MAG: hypothetical protein P0Y65_05955 [Candidatus Devosia phytovorans]|uniref:Uncharacterized protein n=1 Tax=Candidatus Devosia phytovorans TaxID=3121372 RepID=A0AAJ6B1X0_9HYPH|nr:hypothetical protein [Devosia sp.]WEK05799.1 MAG: hypothetical protein P0Y65_05955 [Devosia sp.]